MITSLRRPIAAALVVAMALTAIVLLFSDTAGALFGDFVDLARRAGASFERRSGIDVLDRSQIPGQADQIGHAFFWGAIMLVAGWLLRRRVPIPLTGLLIAAISVMSELAQPLLSTYRAAQAGDALANAIGITVATGILLVAVAVLRRRHGDDRVYFGDTAHEDEPTDELILPH